MNKRDLVQQIISALGAELEGYARSARSAHAEATDEQSKAENKYDTRGLEASYLARGQSRQAMEVAAAISQYESLEVQASVPGEAAAVGTVVEVESGGERTLYFLGPSAGGLEVEHEGTPVLVITPQSPLGQQLLGRKAGDSLQFRLGRSSGTCRILAVS